MTGVLAMPVVARSVVLVTPDADLRQRLGDRLTSMRWQVLSAGGGAEAMAYLNEGAPEAMIVDHWLPDLDAAEFAEHAAMLCPGTDLMQMDGCTCGGGSRSARRNELLHALRESQEAVPPMPGAGPAVVVPQVPAPALSTSTGSNEARMHLPDVVGDTPLMRELARTVRLVAPHSTSVLIQGETGTGKELVAKAVHRLSARASRPFVVLNCAAIPEQLLEAELFGHTRGAFTGAVTSRVGRIEAAHGGTLFLDEIGEMPLPLQAKMLRFLENGELQKIGENDTSRVDVRIVAATHQPLREKAAQKLFREDLYYRLAVFPLDVPALRQRVEDIPMLVEYLLAKLGENAPRRSISSEALALLCAYPWPGNVRELAHALHRASILCDGEPCITPQHLQLHVN